MPDQSEDVRTRPFADVLLDIDRGRLHADASNALQELISAVMATGKAGTIQITLKATKSKSDTPMVEIATTLNVKPPKSDRGASIFYVDDEWNLSRHNPHQLTLPLHEVPAPDSTRTEEQLRQLAADDKLREAK